MTSETSLDSRAWLAWGLAAMTPLLIGRNPWLTLEVLVIVLFVRLSWNVGSSAQGTRWFLRIAGVMAIISIVFNTLTVSSGDRIIATVPDSWPVIGGHITWNAVIYGAVSAVTLFTLVLTGLTVAGLIRWVDLFHVLPPRLAPIAVTGSVAWAFLPQTAIAFTNIREAMTMRGYRFQKARDFLPIMVPMLANGLERSLAMAEALEARGFGASIESITQGNARRGPSVRSLGALMAGLTLMALAAYSLAIGQAATGLAAGLAGGIALMLFARITPTSHLRTTRYRDQKFDRQDWIVTGVSLLAVASTITWGVLSPMSFRFTTYPSITIPLVEPVLMLILALLLLPAYLAPRPEVGP